MRAGSWESGDGKQEFSVFGVSGLSLDVRSVLRARGRSVTRSRTLGSDDPRARLSGVWVARSATIGRADIGGQVRRLVGQCASYRAHQLPEQRAAFLDSAAVGERQRRFAS